MTEAEAIDKITDALDGNHDGSVGVYSTMGNELIVKVGDESSEQLEFKITIKRI